MFLRLPNPIPHEVKDDRDLFDFWKGLKIVPYYGTSQDSSHNMLELYSTLSSLSPTFRGAMLDLTSYTFGRKIDVVERTRPGLVSEEEEIEFSQKTTFDDYLRGLNIKLTKILKLSKKIDHHRNISGNAYLILKRITVADLVRYEMGVVHYKHCAYVLSQDLDEEFMIISKFLGDKEQMYRFPPKILRVTYLDDDDIKWTESQVEGVEEALIHIKAENYYDESEYYARPSIVGCLADLYTDFQLSNLSSKIAATELISKILLALQTPDPSVIRSDQLEDEDGQIVDVDSNGNIGVKAKPRTMFQRNMMTIKELMTNISHHPSSITGQRTASSIAGIEIPPGAAPPTPIPLEVNRDKDYHDWQKGNAVATVCSLLQWSPELLMTRQTKTGLGGNLIYDIFVMKNESTIIPRQLWYEDMWNTILNWIFELEGAPADVSKYAIKFQDTITEMLEKFSNGAGSLTNVGDNVADTTPSTNQIDIDEQSDTLDP